MTQAHSPSHPTSRQTRLIRRTAFLIWPAFLLIALSSGWNMLSAQPEGGVDASKTGKDLIRQMVMAAGKGQPAAMTLAINTLPPDKAADELAGLEHWVRLYGQALHKTEAGPFERQFFGASTRSGQTLYALVTNWPGDGDLYLPQVQGRVTAANILTSTGPKPLTPAIVNNQIKLVVGKQPADSRCSVIQLQIEGSTLAKEDVVEQKKDGTVDLHSMFGRTHGKLLRYEPQAHKNTIGYWAEEKDWAEWVMTISQPGTFEVEILQGCGTGQGGSTLQVAVGDQKLTTLVQDTGHFQNFVPRTIGTIRIDQKGEHRLTIHALKKAKGAVVDIRQVTLRPVAAGAKEAK